MKLKDLPTDLFGTNVILLNDVVEYLCVSNKNYHSLDYERFNLPAMVLWYFVIGELTRKPKLDLGKIDDAAMDFTMFYDAMYFWETEDDNHTAVRINIEDAEEVNLYNKSIKFIVPPEIEYLIDCASTHNVRNRVPTKLILEVIEMFRQREPKECIRNFLNKQLDENYRNT